MPTIGNGRWAKRNVIIPALMIGGLRSHIVLECLCMNICGRNLSCCRLNHESELPFLFLQAAGYRNLKCFVEPNYCKHTSIITINTNELCLKYKFQINSFILFFFSFFLNLDIEHLLRTCGIIKTNMEF